MKSDQTKRWPLRAVLVGFVLVHCIYAETLAQVIVSSRPMVHHEVDAVTCVTDYRDSVFVITKAGNVVAYNQDFTGERLVHEAMQLHATSAYVYDGALFFESSSGQYLINDDGRWQYVDLSPAVVSRDATMMPFAVTDFGVFELRRGGDGSFVPVQLGHRIERQGSIFSMARIDDCIVVSYQRVSPPAPPCTLHRPDGTVEHYPVDPETYGVRFLPGPESSLIVAGWHNYYWITHPCVSTTNRVDHITDDNNAIRASGIFTRTGASAPWAHAVLHASWSASRLYMYDGTMFNKQMWYGGADSLYLHYNSATSDSAIYAWGNDGWVVRYGLTSSRVSVRRTIVPRRYRVQLELSAGDYRLLSSFAEVDNRDSAQHIFVTSANATYTVPLEVFAEYSQRPRHGNVRHFLPYPSGSELIITSSFLVLRDADGLWRAKRLPTTINTTRYGVFVLDDSTFVYRGIAYCERDGRIVEQVFHTEIESFSTNPSFAYRYADGHLIGFRDRIILARIRHSDDSVVVELMREFMTTWTPNEIVPASTRGDSLVTLMSIERGDSLFEDNQAPLIAINVRRLTPQFTVVDSMRIAPRGRERVYMIIPLGDTLYRIDPRDNIVKRMTPDYESEWMPLKMMPGVARFVLLNYTLGSLWRDGRQPALDFHSPERVHTIVFGKDSTTLSAQSTDALDNDVVLQHIFMMNVYPNPTSDRATLEMRRHQSSESSPTELFLADLSGARVRDYSSTTTFTFPVGTLGRTTLDLTNLPSGPYLLVMRNGGFTSSKLLMIAK